MLSQTPALGVGIGWRTEIAQETMANLAQIDFVEVISEHYMNVTPERLNQLSSLASRVPVIPHGLDLSIGTDTPVEDEYLDALASLVDLVDAPWFSDHLCFTRVPGYSIGQLTPLQFSDQAVETVVRKTQAVTHRIPRLFALENITYAFAVPKGQMSEAEFITRVVEGADIGLLLDVTNVYINSTNHGYDPYKFLKSIPLDRVVQLHLAGGVQRGGRWVDSHSHPVPEEVFELTDFVVANAPVKGILLERDENFPVAFQELVDELARMRSIFRKHNQTVCTAAAR
jgi:uncharacterized protein (UPF0276 family)